MIDRVIIAGIRRAGARLPIREIRQMAGRAGRSYSKAGEAILLVPPNEASEAAACWEAPVEAVESQMDAEAAAAQVLPAIRRAGGAFGEAAFVAWYARSLAYAHARTILRWAAVRECLEAAGAIVAGAEDCVALSPLGELACALCYAPERVAMADARLGELPPDALAGDCAAVLAWLMATSAPAWLLSEEACPPSYEDFREANRNYGLPYATEAAEADGFACWCVFTGTPGGRLGTIVRERRRESGRFLALVAGLAASRKMPFDRALWELAIQRRLPYALATIARHFPGLPREGIAELSEFGIANPAALAARKENILPRCSEKLAKWLAGAPYIAEAPDNDAGELACE